MKGISIRSLPPHPVLTLAKDVYPESTVESASQRYPHSKPPRPKGNDLVPSVKRQACESTIESGTRRNFIRKAALATAAIGAGSVVLGDTLLPRASATTPRLGPKCYCCVCNQLFINGSIRVIDHNPCYPSCPCYCKTCVTGIFVENERTCKYSAGILAYGEGYKFPSCPNCIPYPGRATGAVGLAWDNIGVYGWSHSGPGVVGATQTLTPPTPCDVGVYGIANTGTGISGHSSTGIGVFGCSDGSSGSGRGVKGVSALGTGVYGCSTCGTGVKGISKAGRGVHGTSTTDYAVFGCSSCNVGVGGSGKLYGVQGCALNNCGRHVGVVGSTGHGAGSAGVAGYATGGCTRCTAHVTAGVYGQSDSLLGQGVSGVSLAGCCSVGVGVIGRSCGSCGIGVKGVAGRPCTVPIVASGASGQFANLQQWEKGATTVSVVNKCGWLGIGTSSAPTTLRVAGSISAKVASPTTAYKMGATDFAVFASASSGAFTVTLPPASTATGMIVLIKKMDTSSNSVTVAGAGSGTTQDYIEGSASRALKKQYDSLQLISNGGHEWMIFAGSICHSFVF